MNHKLISVFGLLLILAACSDTGIPPKQTTVAVKSPAEGMLLLSTIDGNLPMVRQLLDEGSNPNENLGSDGNYLTPLLATISYGYSDLGLYLLSRGASAEVYFEGYSATELAAHALSATDPLSRALLDHDYSTAVKQVNP